MREASTEPEEAPKEAPAEDEPLVAEAVFEIAVPVPVPGLVAAGAAEVLVMKVLGALPPPWLKFPPLAPRSPPAPAPAPLPPPPRWSLWAKIEGAESMAARMYMKMERILYRLLVDFPSRLPCKGFDRS